LFFSPEEQSNDLVKSVKAIFSPSSHLCAAESA